MPMVHSNALDASRPTWHPKYAVPFQKWSALDFGAEKVCICGIRNVTSEEHSALIANADLVAFPVTLTNKMSQIAVNRLSVYLESLNIPADWITTAITYKKALRVIGALFQFGQRWSKVSGGSSPFKEGLTLTQQYSELDVSAKAKTHQCFDSLGVDRSAINNTSTLRDILKVFATEFVKNKSVFCGEKL